jgi:hypothetical protein
MYDTKIFVFCPSEKKPGVTVLTVNLFLLNVSFSLEALKSLMLGALDVDAK